MNNKFYRTCTLHLKASVKNNKTILEDAYYTPPYKVMRPFYLNKDYMTVMCMSSSSGTLAGDIQEFKIEVNDGAKLEYISQEYEKIHKMEEGSAKRTTDLFVGKNAFLYFNPLPTIPFAGSAFQSIVDVHLTDDTSTFIMKEILSAGRSARGERFLYRFYHNLINVYCADQLIYRDNTRYEPSHMALDAMGMYEGYTHLGSLLLFHTNKGPDWISQARSVIQETDAVDGGVTTLNQNALIVRILGYQSEKIDRLLDQLIAL